MAHNDWLNEASDSTTGERPGVPQMNEERRPVGHAHWNSTEKQTPLARTLRDATRAELTATFGTGQPPRGLSGALRRVAYRLPDYKVKRWALLLFADRIDALEDAAGRMMTTPATWVAITAGGIGLRGVLRRRRPSGWKAALRFGRK